MIIIRYQEPPAELEAWEYLLRELVVAYRFERTTGLEEPVLQEEQYTVAGPAAIQAYLQQLKKDVEDWRAPGCGI